MDVTRLEKAREWLEFASQEGTEQADEYDLVFRAFVESYIAEISHKLGLHNAYLNDLQRLEKLKDSVRSTDTLYEMIAQVTREEESVSNDAQSLLTFLNSATLEMAGVINEIERQHPHLKSIFAAERKHYAETLKGREAESF